MSRRRRGGWFYEPQRWTYRRKTWIRPLRRLERMPAGTAVAVVDRSRIPSMRTGRMSETFVGYGTVWSQGPNHGTRWVQMEDPELAEIQGCRKVLITRLYRRDVYDQRHGKKKA